jgi:hypothetical protein
VAAKTLAQIGLAAAISLAGAAARAEPPRPGDLSSYSQYEQQTLQIGLANTGRTVEPEPEGKIIEGIDFVTLEVFEKRDPIPARLNKLVNWFHVTTKPRYVERELLFKVGDRYSLPVVEESARNVRALPQFSVVLVMPTNGSAPGRIRMLVITKDLWSLRVPTEYRLTSSGALEYAQVQVTEINLFGRHNQVAANFIYNPHTVAVGGLFVVPRIADSRFRLTTEVNAIVNYRTGAFEGSTGQFSYSKPLFSLASEWGYGARIAWNNDIRRLYISSRVSVYDGATHKCVRSDKLTEGQVGIPCEYSRDIQSGRMYLTRSLGHDVKHNFTLSAEVSRSIYRTDDLSAYEPALAEDFKQRVPRVSDMRVGPALQYTTFSARYLRVHDFERLGLQEEYLLGHNLILKVAPAYAPLRSSNSVVGLFAGASYTFPLSDGLLRLYAESNTDFEPDRISDGSIDVGVRVVSPKTWFGRLVFDGRLFHRYANYLNGIDALGGDTRLRGYPTDLFRGKDLFVANLELRTRPFELLSCQIGGVLFLDAGDAFDGFSDLFVKRSAGFGLRAMLPQINRIVFRADWGFPLAPLPADRKAGGFPGELTFTFGQAFPVPQVPVSQATEQ